MVRPSIYPSPQYPKEVLESAQRALFILPTADAIRLRRSFTNNF